MSIGQLRLNFKQTAYSILLGALGIILLSASLLVPTTHALTLDLDARDCDNNAVIKCGAASTQELLQKYNSQADVRAIFNQFGISPSEMGRIGSTAVAGIVNRDNQVIVNGEVVATGAMTAGRQNMSGSTAVSAGGTTFYKRAPSVSFQTQRLKAFVVMTGDSRFSFAIIGSCGNPVVATPKPKPQPKPQPTPAPAKPQPKPPAPQPQPQPKPQPAPPAPAPEQNNNQQQSQSQAQQQAAVAVAENNVTINQEKAEQPAPQVVRVEVPPAAVPQPTTVAAAPAPVQELPKTGMEGTSKTLSLAGLTALGTTVAHLLFIRRRARLQEE